MFIRGSSKSAEALFRIQWVLIAGVAIPCGLMALAQGEVHPDRWQDAADLVVIGTAALATLDALFGDFKEK